MKDRKIIFRSFNYWECDSFAEYLHKMSSKGWHFTGWKLGMVFEKGMPTNIDYAVEVFPKGSEMDTRPEPDTEEYADYCEAAGWKFIDSRKKFCVFRKERSDALSIVTLEERFSNIKNAGWRRWIGNSSGITIITVLYWISLFKLNFERWIFDDLMLLLILLGSLGCFVRVIEGIIMLRVGYKKKREIRAGIGAIYKSKPIAVMQFLGNYMVILVIITILLAACYKENYLMAVSILTMAILLLLFGTILAIWRPSREDNWTFQIVGSLVMFFISTAVIVMIIVTSPGAQEIPVQQDIPLVQTDYKSVTGELAGTDRGYQEGVLGTMQYFNILYKGTQDPDKEKSDTLWYYVYESEHQWILNQIWQQHFENAKQQEACTEEWEAVSAIYEHRAGNLYTVLYQRRLLYLYSSSSLEREQIQVIRDKLKLE